MVNGDVYYIEPIHVNNLLDVKVLLLNFFKKIPDVSFLKPTNVDFLNETSAEMLTTTLYLLKIIPALEIGDIENFYMFSEKALKDFSKMYYALEKVNFFDNVVTKETCSVILKTLYKAEARLRHLYFDSVTNNHDKALNEAATLISVQSV